MFKPNELRNMEFKFQKPQPPILNIIYALVPRIKLKLRSKWKLINMNSLGYVKSILIYCSPDNICSRGRTKLR